MSSDNVWHDTYKTSMWNGEVTAWCGAKQKSGHYRTDTFVLVKTAPRCPACKAAKKGAKK